MNLINRQEFTTWSTFLHVAVGVSEMDIVHLKVLAGFLFLGLALFFGWTPLVLLRYIKSETKRPTCLLTQHLHALASGVLLATCLLHLLPESVQTVHQAMAGGNKDQVRPFIGENENISQAQNIFHSAENEDNNVIDNDGFYPLAELLLALGFLCIYCVDNIIKTWHAVEEHGEVEETELGVVERWKEDGHFIKQSQVSDQVKLLWDSSTLIPSSENGQKVLTDDVIERNDLCDEDESLRQISGFRMNSQTDYTASDEAHPLAERRHLDKVEKIKSAAPRVRSLALVAALCIHGFFDGVMLGLQSSESVLLSLMLALSLHKSFVAVSLSLTLSSSAPTDSRKHSPNRAFEILHIFLFASAAPLGLILSSVFVHTAFDLSLGTSAGVSDDVSVIPGCLQAFAVGTFLYVTFSELTELSKHTKVDYSENRRKLLIRTMVNYGFFVGWFYIHGWATACSGLASVSTPNTKKALLKIAFWITWSSMLYFLNRT